MTEHLLSIERLRVFFDTFEGTARAVNDVSFHLKPGEMVGIVGESGCGKSVTAQTIMGLTPMPPGRIAGGHIRFDGEDITSLDPARMRHIRGKRIAMIFQEPMTSLNPVFTIGDQIAEMFMLHEGASRKEGMERAADMLAKVHIPAPHKRIHDYPHQLSGGMRQRVMIAMAMSCNPELLIADEPTTALDVTVQAQILDLMVELQEANGTAVMMITHDLGVVAETTKRVVVMYAGQVVEQAPATTIFSSPLHPYTKGLQASIPLLGKRRPGARQRLQEITGMVPNLYDLPSGCHFADRCPHVRDICRNAMPPLQEIAPGHLVRCTLHNPPTGPVA